MFEIVFVIVGTLIGAGFASGREIFLFFTQYGINGILGIMLTAVITSFAVYRVLILVKVFEINNYNDLLTRINWRHPKINKFIYVIISSFLLVSFYIMVAGFSGYINQMWKVPIYVSASIFSFICYLVFKNKIEGVVKVNKLLTPLLIILIVYIGLKNLPYFVSHLDILNQYREKHWIISSILYASYNSIILIPVLIGLKSFVKGKKQIICVCILIGVAITILALLIFGLLLKDTYFISQLELPLAEISLSFGEMFKYIYAIIIIASIFTSAISAGYGFIKGKKNQNYLLPIMCISAVFISNIGFSKLVAFLYPLFGILGLVQIFLLFKKTP